LPPRERLGVFAYHLKHFHDLAQQHPKCFFIGDCGDYRLILPDVTEIHLNDESILTGAAEAHLSDEDEEGEESILPGVAEARLSDESILPGAAGARLNDEDGTTKNARSSGDLHPPLIQGKLSNR
jgi:hypothetical protein